MPADYATITAAHLFGEVSNEPPPLTGDAALTAPDTSLALQLRGAIAADDPRFAHAIIADGSGKRAGLFRELHLAGRRHRAADPGGPGHPRARRASWRSCGCRERARARARRAGRAQRPDSRQHRQAAVPASRTSRNWSRRTPRGFFEVVRPQPFMPNGQLKGYRIYPGPNRQQFASLGLRAGDLVTEINGIALNNPAQGMEVFRSLGDAPQVTVTVERDGQPQVLSLNMTQINAVGATQ